MSQAEQKKSKTLLYVIGGCAVLSFVFIVLILVGFFFGKKIQTYFSNPSEAIVKIITQNNPDVEVVSIDQKSKKIVLKNKKTGEVMTIDFSDAAKGRIVWKGKGEKGRFEISSDEKEEKIEISKEGEKTTITYGGDEIPAWLSDLKGFKVKNNITSKTEDQISGTVEVETSINFDEASKILEDFFKGKGIVLMKTIFQQEENQKQAMLQGKSKDEKYNVLIYLMVEEDQTKGTISYTEKKGE